MPTPPVLPGVLYHVYNRGVSRQMVFTTDDQYRRFLRLLGHHVLPCARVYAFALLPNHFHLLLRPRDAAPRSASQALSNACNAYAQTYNRETARTGALFCRPFQRKAVRDERYAAAVVRYLHDNAAHHGIVPSGDAWPYTSAGLLESPRPSRLERETVRDWLNAAPLLPSFGLPDLPDLLGEPL